MRTYCCEGFQEPLITAVIDTEERFGWLQSFSRDAIDVSHMRHIHRLQDVFDDHGVVPLYAVDYAVASQRDGYLPLRTLLERGCCTIGAHVHPWVTPPFEETLSRRNSFPGNLPPGLEAAKLERLAECIHRNLGVRPVVYKAGRYGLGPNTPQVIQDQGYETDVSLCPHMDFSYDGGPNFLMETAWPFWFGKDRRLLEIPMTVGFLGKLRKWGCRIHPKVTSRSLEYAHVPGILARLRLLNRVWLSPEGNSADEMIWVTRALHSDGLRVFTLCLHSTSVEPGNTEYVQTEEDLNAMLNCMRRYFDFFIGELGGRPSTPTEITATLRAALSKKGTEVQ